jgi:RNA polymerase sigma factor (sigma-70 family)
MVKAASRECGSAGFKESFQGSPRAYCAPSDRETQPLAAPYTCFRACRLNVHPRRWLWVLRGRTRDMNAVSRSREKLMSEDASEESGEAAATELPLDGPVVAALVENHRAFLAFLEKRVGRRDLAEDLLQEAFARGLKKLPPLGTEESSIAWFYRVLRNAVIDHHRRGGANERVLSRLAIEFEDHIEPDLDTKNAICRCVALLADTLKPEYAMALRRVEVDGVSLQDFAGETGITPNNAGVRVFRARESLRKRVARSCGTCADHGCLDCTCGMPRGGGARVESDR